MNDMKSIQVRYKCHCCGCTLSGMFAGHQEMLVPFLVAEQSECDNCLTMKAIWPDRDVGIPQAVKFREMGSTEWSSCGL